MKNLAIIGAGSWGTALSIALGSRFSRTKLWVHDPSLASIIAATRINHNYLPGSLIPNNIEITHDLTEALFLADCVLTVTPSHVTRNICLQMRPQIKPGMVFVSGTKGLETNSLLRTSEVISEVLGHVPVGVLSGPSFASEVARFEPTALVVASFDSGLAEAVQSAFSGPTFRVYASSDPIGVEIGGSIKNVVAIGAGVLHGMGLGHNAMAALITRGLAEITRLAVAMGGKPQTLAGLAGIGDLVLTCTGDLSRNRNLGIQLAQGRRLGEIVQSTKMVAEGVKTTNAVIELAKRYSIEMPIAQQMFQILHFGSSPQEAIRRLMERSLTVE